MCIPVVLNITSWINSISKSAILGNLELIISDLQDILCTLFWDGQNILKGLIEHFKGYLSKSFFAHQSHDILNYSLHKPSVYWDAEFILTQNHVCSDLFLNGRQINLYLADLNKRCYFMYIFCKFNTQVYSSIKLNY